MNLDEFLAGAVSLTVKKATQRVSKLNLASKTTMGDIYLHVIPDAKGYPFFTQKAVYETHQTEKYNYNGEDRTRYVNYIIPSLANYSSVKDAVEPTEMQKTKLQKLCELLEKFRDYTNAYSPTGLKFDTHKTETGMWVKRDSFYTKFWAKISQFKPVTPAANAKALDTSKLIMCTHTSSDFITAFNKWYKYDPDSDIPQEEQLAKCQKILSKDIVDDDSAPCIKITTSKATNNMGYVVDMKNANAKDYHVNITNDDLTEATPLICEDWDYTAFDDEKVDTLTTRVSKYLEQIEASAEYAKWSSDNKAKKEAAAANAAPEAASVNPFEGALPTDENALTDNPF